MKEAGTAGPTTCDSQTSDGRPLEMAVSSELDALDEIESRLIEAFSMLKWAGEDELEAVRRMSLRYWPVKAQGLGQRRSGAGLKDSPEPRGAGSAEVERMKEALSWLLLLDDETRTIVAARAARAPWKVVLDRLMRRYSRRHALRIYRRGLTLIAAEIRKSATTPLAT